MELHISADSPALTEEIMTLPIEEAGLLVEDEPDEDGELDRAKGIK